MPEDEPQIATPDVTAAPATEPETEIPQGAQDPERTLEPPEDSELTAQMEAAVADIHPQDRLDELQQSSSDDLDLLAHTPERAKIEDFSEENASELAKNPKARELFSELKEAQAELIEALAAAKQLEKISNKYVAIIEKLDDIVSPRTPQKVEQATEPAEEMKIFGRGQQPEAPAQVAPDAAGLRVQAEETATVEDTPQQGTEA